VESTGVLSLTAGERAGRRAALLALAVMFSAGIHAALVPEHLVELPRLGDAFIAAAAIGTVVACGLVVRPRDSRLRVLAGVFCLGQIVAWAVFVTVAVPGFTSTPEGVEPIAVVAKVVEGIAALLAFAQRPS
jgi:hypothetical protein